MLCGSSAHYGHVAKSGVAGHYAIALKGIAFVGGGTAERCACTVYVVGAAAFAAMGSVGFGVDGDAYVGSDFNRAAEVVGKGVLSNEHMSITPPNPVADISEYGKPAGCRSLLMNVRLSSAPATPYVCHAPTVGNSILTGVGGMRSSSTDLQATAAATTAAVASIADIFVNVMRRMW